MYSIHFYCNKQNIIIRTVLKHVFWCGDIMEFIYPYGSQLPTLL